MSEIQVHTEIEELLGAYALDALDPVEARQVENHLRDCPRCRAEVASYREVASAMATTGSDAPVQLWQRIAAAMESGGPNDKTGLYDSHALLALNRPKSHSMPAKRWPLWAVSAAAVAAAVLAAFLGIQVNHLDERVSALGTAVEATGVRQLAMAALLQPNARRVPINNAKGQAVAEAVVLPDGEGFIVNASLEQLPANRTYQLWAISASGKISLGLLGSHPSYGWFRLDPASQVQDLAITDQRAGGVAITNRAPVGLGSLIQ